MERMSRPDRGRPMTVKHWTRAGLMLTDWCNAACACCYANCGPHGAAWLGAEQAVAVWAGLVRASPHGCRVHLTGGEPFGRFEHLLAVCRLAQRQGVGPLESIETNAFWADDDGRTRQWLAALDEAGMGRLSISADPYHQQFVPIDRPRRLAQIARQALGPQRVRVRWEDWLADGADTSALPADERGQLFDRYAARGRYRLTGRAVDGLTGQMPRSPAAQLACGPCGHRLLRGGHVHVSATGEVWPATCLGIAIGNALLETPAEIWARLDRHWRGSLVVGPLAQHGPTALLARAGQTGFVPRAGGYATKCQLCFELRRHLIQHDEVAEGQLGPMSVYATSC